MWASSLSSRGGTSAQKFHEIGPRSPLSLVPATGRRHGRTPPPHTKASVASDGKKSLSCFLYPLNKEAREEKGIGEKASWGDEGKQKWFRCREFMEQYAWQKKIKIVLGFGLAWGGLDAQDDE
jgi:hypothetical protein